GAVADGLAALLAAAVACSPHSTETAAAPPLPWAPARRTTGASRADPSVGPSGGGGGGAPRPADALRALSASLARSRGPAPAASGDRPAARAACRDRVSGACPGVPRGWHTDPRRPPSRGTDRGLWPPWAGPRRAVYGGLSPVDAYHPGGHGC